MALTKSVIDDWSSKEFLNIDGYRSSSLDYNMARYFAHAGKTDEKLEVVLKIRMENKHGKYYFCLDKDEYTLYLDEQEVLLQAGLVA